jgi:hypothetical protein
MVLRVVGGKLTTFGSDLDSLTNLTLMDAYDFSLCSLDGKGKCSACFPHGNVPLMVDYAVQRAHPAFESVPMYLDTYSRIHGCRASTANQAHIFPAPAQLKALATRISTSYLRRAQLGLVGHHHEKSFIEKMSKVLRGHIGGAEQGAGPIHPQNHPDKIPDVRTKGFNLLERSTSWFADVLHVKGKPTREQAGAQHHERHEHSALHHDHHEHRSAMSGIESSSAHRPYARPFSIFNLLFVGSCDS